MNQIETSPEADEDRGGVKSLTKALNLLDMLGRAGRSMSVSELAREAGVNRPTAYRLLQTLAASGYVQHDPVTGHFSIGYSVLPLSSALLDNNRFRLEALPHLQALSVETGERSNLGILHRGRVLYLAGVEKPNLPMIYSRFGKTAPVHCCSLGKMLLSLMPDTEAMAIVGRGPLEAQTAHSITRLDAFLEDLEATRRRGYAVDRQEHMLGSFCVAAPIFGPGQTPLGAISISCSSLDKATGHVDSLLRKAELISHVV